MMSDVSTNRTLPTTTDEFLTWPGDGRAKHYELVDGRVRAMSPASALHGLIQATLASIIRQHLRESGSACKILAEPAVKPRLRAAINLRVPDLGVTCAPIAAGQIVMEEPLLLIEILSPSNKAQTWTNVWAYTTIPTVREILVVHSTRVEVQRLGCSDQRIWPDNPETLKAGEMLTLRSIGLACPVDDIYADTSLI